MMWYMDMWYLLRYRCMHHSWHKIVLSNSAIGEMVWIIQRIDTWYLVDMWVKHLSQKIENVIVVNFESCNTDNHFWLRHVKKMELWQTLSQCESWKVVVWLYIELRRTRCSRLDGCHMSVACHVSWLSLFILIHYRRRRGIVNYLEKIGRGGILICNVWFGYKKERDKQT